MGQGLDYAGGARIPLAVRFVPKRRLRERMGGKTPVDPAALGPLLTRLAWVVLCSGSYTLVDVVVEEEGEALGVRIRLI